MFICKIINIEQTEYKNKWIVFLCFSHCFRSVWTESGWNGWGWCYLFNDCNYITTQWFSELNCCVCACVCTGPSAGLIVKEEFDPQPSHSSSDGPHSLQTIQHQPAPSHSAPPTSTHPPLSETFSSPALMPPPEAASSAPSPAFSSMAPTPACKTCSCMSKSTPCSERNALCCCVRRCAH